MLYYALLLKILYLTTYLKSSFFILQLISTKIEAMTTINNGINKNSTADKDLCRSCSQVVTSDRAQIILGAAIDFFGPSMMSLTFNSFDEIVFVFIVNQCPVITLITARNQEQAIFATRPTAMMPILAFLHPYHAKYPQLH